MALRNNRRRVLYAAAPMIAALASEKDAYKAELEFVQGQFKELQAELRELRAAVLARHRADAELAALYRERAIQRARATERDPLAPLH
jgi:hypothetical protein